MYCKNFMYSHPVGNRKTRKTRKTIFAPEDLCPIYLLTPMKNCGRKRGKTKVERINASGYVLRNYMISENEEVGSFGGGGKE